MNLKLRIEMRGVKSVLLEPDTINASSILGVSRILRDSAWFGRVWASGCVVILRGLQIDRVNDRRDPSFPACSSRLNTGRGGLLGNPRTTYHYESPR